MGRKSHTLNSLLIAGVVMLFGSAATLAAPPYPSDVSFIGGSVSRATFTSAVVNREPVDRLIKLTRDHPYVYYFTELKGMTGRTVIHRWEYNGKVIKETKFAVGAPRWRIWSAQMMTPQQTGLWTVSVIDDHNEVVQVDEIKYTPMTHVSQR